MIKNRANTDEEKRVVIEQLLTAWKRVPELRLGQLLECAMYYTNHSQFYIEDFLLVNAVHEFVENQERKEI